MKIQIELAEARVTRIKRLMEELEIDTYKDLFNNALAVFDWMVEETRSGRVIASVGTSDKRQYMPVVPALMSVRPTHSSDTVSHQ